MQRLKAKKRSQSPPPLPLIPHFNFGYLFITNTSQKNCLLLQKEGVEYSKIHKYQNFPPLWSKMLLIIIISKVSIIIDTKEIEELW